MRLLVESNADVRVRDKDNLSALLKAANLKHDRVVEVLLATSRDALARDGQIDRALIVAALLDDPTILGLLLDKGANVNARIENGQTALMFAATFGKRDIVETLLARGADPKLVDKDGANASVLALGARFPGPGEIYRHPHARRPATAGRRATAAVPARRPAHPPRPRRRRPRPSRPPPTLRAWRWSARGSSKTASSRSTLLKKDTGQDDDGDGFTNDEELAAGTDPNDPKSHPPYYTKLRMKRLDGEAFPVTFDDYDSKTKKVHVTVHDKSGYGFGGAEGGARKVELGQGDTVPGVGYTVTKLKLRRTTEKDTARPLDMSELTLTDPQTGSKVVLVKGMPASSPDAAAVLTFGIDDKEIAVQQGETFTLPRDPDTRLEVIDIRPTQVILKVVGTGQTVTVDKEEKERQKAEGKAEAGRRCTMKVRASRRSAPHLSSCIFSPPSPSPSAFCLPMPIPLEDQLTDVIGKARRGLRLSEAQLAQNSGVGLENVEAFAKGRALDDADTVAKVARALDLYAPALLDLGRGEYEPGDVSAPPTLAAYNVPFGDDMTVNFYLAWDKDGGQAAAFDTGGDCGALLATLRERRLKLGAIFLTHTHEDHIADLDRLTAETDAPVYVSEREPLRGRGTRARRAAVHGGRADDHRAADARTFARRADVRRRRVGAGGGGGGRRVVCGFDGRRAAGEIRRRRSRRTASTFFRCPKTR